MHQRTRMAAVAGFTLIEVIFSIAFITILSAIGYASLSTFRPQADISSISNQIVATLQFARNRTQASEGDTVYGVHFESDRYVLFAGSAYDDMDPDNEVHELVAGVEIHNIALTGGSDVVFDRITGTTSNSGEIGLRLVADTNNQRTISVLSSGLIGFAGTVTPTDTRVTDSRHAHFDLGWSIQGATTLTLTFSNAPDPDVVENIDMTLYFDAGQTVFDWEGIVSVGGDNQIMRIHTHQIDATSTILSVNRDRRYNDKPVLISIDGKDIVSYDATDTPTVESFGGTMEIQ